MPTNGQQLGSDYFATTSIYMNDLMSNVREEYANRLEREQSYNEWLQQRIDGLDDTIRQYGVIRDTQEHREMGYYFQLAGLDDRQQRRVSSASRVALRATGNLVEDQRERFREGMSGEAGEDVALSRILNSGLDMDGLVDRLVQEIHENPTMGRLFGDQFLSSAGGGGQGHIAAQIGGGLGISDALIRLNAASNTGFTDDQLRTVGARTVGLESGAALSDQAAAEAQRLLSSQTLTQTANIPTISGIHAWLREQAPSWGVTEEMIRAEVELAGAQEQRAELRGELDARLQEQQSRDPDAEIESAFRDRLGPVGEGAQFSDTVLGAIQREHAGRRRRERTERIRNMSQSERILMGSVGEAREMANTWGTDAEREGASWDAARAMVTMAQANGIADNDALVARAAEMSQGDNDLRNEILRNYLYMRQIERGGTELNTPQTQAQRDDEVLRRAADRAGEDYRSSDAARISDAQSEVAQRNVHGPITSTGSDGWADYNLHDNGIISYRHPEDNSLRRVPRGDPQYNRLLAVINGEEVPEARGADPVPPVEGSPNATPEQQATGDINARMAEVWADPNRENEREALLAEARELGDVTPARGNNPPRVGVVGAAGVETPSQQIERDTDSPFAPSPWAWNTRGAESKAHRLSQLNAYLRSSWSADPSERARITAEVLGELPEGSRLYWPIGEAGGTPEVMTAQAIQQGGLRKAGDKARFVGEEHRGQFTPSERRQQLNDLLSSRPNPSDYSSDAEYHIASRRWTNTHGAEVDSIQSLIRESERFGPSPRQERYEQRIEADLAGQRGERLREEQSQTAFDAAEKVLLERANESRNRGSGIPRSTVPVGGGGVGTGRAY